MNLRRTHVLSAIVAVGIACVPVLFLRCTDSPSLAADGGVDVATERSSRDRNVVPDVSDVDAGPVCSPPPGADGVVHDWPGWTRTTTGLDLCCPYDSLDDLSKAVPYEWVPCDDAGGECLRFNAPTADIATNEPVVAAQMVRGASGVASQIFVQRNSLKGNVSERSVYDFATGVPKASWRLADSPHCVGDVVATTDDSAMLFLALYPTDFAATSGGVVATGKVETLTQTPAGAKTGLPWNFLMDGYANGRALFANFYGSIATCDMHTLGAPKCLQANVASIAPANLNGYTEFFIEGEYIYALSTHGNLGWSQEYVVGPTGDVKLLRGVANTHVGGLASDGKNLTWVEVQGDKSLTNPQKIEEVWSAPLTSDPNQLTSTAKKLATLPAATAPNPGLSFNGYYSVAAFGEIYVVRISDGKLIKAPAMPAPYRLYQVFYLTSTEIWVMATHNSSIQLFRLALPTWL